MEVCKIGTKYIPTWQGDDEWAQLSATLYCDKNKENNILYSTHGIHFFLLGIETTMLGAIM